MGIAKAFGNHQHCWWFSLYKEPRGGPFRPAPEDVISFIAKRLSCSLYPFFLRRFPLFPLFPGPGGFPFFQTVFCCGVRSCGRRFLPLKNGSQKPPAVPDKTLSENQLPPKAPAGFSIAFKQRKALSKTRYRSRTEPPETIRLPSRLLPYPPPVQARRKQGFEWLP